MFKSLDCHQGIQQIYAILVRTGRAVMFWASLPGLCPAQVTVALLQAAACKDTGVSCPSSQARVNCPLAGQASRTSHLPTLCCRSSIPGKSGQRAWRAPFLHPALTQMVEPSSRWENWFPIAWSLLPCSLVSCYVWTGEPRRPSQKANALYNIPLTKKGGPFWRSGSLSLPTGLE